jgi:hypothetical protein
MAGGGAASTERYRSLRATEVQPTPMSLLADDVAAHDWSVAGAGICGKPGRSMATLIWQRHICTSAAVADRGPARKNGILNL